MTGCPQGRRSEVSSRAAAAGAQSPRRRGSSSVHRVPLELGLSLGAGLHAATGRNDRDARRARGAHFFTIDENPLDRGNYTSQNFSSATAQIWCPAATRQRFAGAAAGGAVAAQAGLALAVWQAIDARHVRSALGCCESGWRSQAGHERGIRADGRRGRAGVAGPRNSRPAERDMTRSPARKLHERRMHSDQVNRSPLVGSTSLRYYYVTLMPILSKMVALSYRCLKAGVHVSNTSSLVILTADYINTAVFCK
jgi:hypothetical protein